MVAPDGAGFSSGAEYAAGTDARRSNSFFCVQSSGMVLSWSAVTERVYRVLRTDRLTDAFTSAATIEYPTTTYADDSGFYRVHIGLPAVNWQKIKFGTFLINH